MRDASTLLETRLFLVEFVFILGLLATVAIAGFHAVGDFFVTVPTGGLWSDAPGALEVPLTMVASIAVVVWTAATVLFTIKPQERGTFFGTDLLGFCFIGIPIALVAHAEPFLSGHALRMVATFFAIRYYFIYVNALRSAVRTGSAFEKQYALTGLFRLLPIYLVVVVVPTLAAVGALCCWLLYYGLWKILDALFKTAAAKAADGDRQN